MYLLAFLQISDKMFTPIKALKNENNLCTYAC